MKEQNSVSLSATDMENRANAKSLHHKTPYMDINVLHIAAQIRSRLVDDMNHAASRSSSPRSSRILY
jgi:hypothetical protein